jgi:low affinity Fe/Cu permease
LLKRGRLRRTLGESASPRSPSPRQELKYARRPADRRFSGSVSAQSDWFSGLAVHTAILTGKPISFLGAVALVAIWAVTGPLFHCSDTWQLVINTGTTIITFLMVFLIQATQNRDTLALQIKLSELILALEGGRNELAAVEEQPEKALENIAQMFTPARMQTPLTTQSNRIAVPAGPLLERRLGREKAQQHDWNKPLPADAAARLETDPHHPGVEQRRAAASGSTLERGTLSCAASAQRRGSQGAGGDDQENTGGRQRPKYGTQLDRRPGIEADTQEDKRSKRG